MGSTGGVKLSYSEIRCEVGWGEGWGVKFSFSKVQCGYWVLFQGLLWGGDGGVVNLSYPIQRSGVG